MNKTDLMAGVRMYLDVTDAELPDNELNIIIAAAEGEMFRALSAHPMLRATLTLPVTDNIATLPTGTVMVWEVSINGITLDQVERIDDLISGKFVIRGLDILFSESDSPDSAIVYCNKTPNPIDVATANWILDMHPDVYTYAILKEAAIYTRNPDGYAQWNKEYIERLGGLINQGWNMDLTPGAEICV